MLLDTKRERLDRTRFATCRCITPEGVGKPKLQQQGPCAFQHLPSCLFCNAIRLWSLRRAHVMPPRALQLAPRHFQLCTNDIPSRHVLSRLRSRLVASEPFCGAILLPSRTHRSCQERHERRWRVQQSSPRSPQLVLERFHLPSQMSHRAVCSEHVCDGRSDPLKAPGFVSTYAMNEADASFSARLPAPPPPRCRHQQDPPALKTARL